MDKIAVFLKLLSIASVAISIEEQFPYITPSNCSETQYFDWNSVKCHPCPDGFKKSDNG